MKETFVREPHSAQARDPVHRRADSTLLLSLALDPSTHQTSNLQPPTSNLPPGSHHTTHPYSTSQPSALLMRPSAATTRRSGPPPSRRLARSARHSRPTPTLASGAGAGPSPRPKPKLRRHRKVGAVEEEEFTRMVRRARAELVWCCNRGSGGAGEHRLNRGCGEGRKG